LPFQQSLRNIIFDYIAQVLYLHLNIHMKKTILMLSIALLGIAGCEKETVKPECPTVSKIETIQNNTGGIIDHKITLSNGSIINKSLTRLVVGEKYCY